jgi:hypothetical protein
MTYTASSGWLVDTNGTTLIGGSTRPTKSPELEPARQSKEAKNFIYRD